MSGLVGSAQAPAQQAFQAPEFSGQELTDCLAFGEARTARLAPTGTVRFIGTAPDRPILHPGPQALGSPDSAARAYLSTCASLFGLQDAANELAVTRSTRIDGFRSVVRLQQRHQGVPVLGGELVVHLDNNNNIVTVAGKTLPSMALNTAPTIDPRTAASSALDFVAATYGMDRQTLTATTPELWVYAPPLIGPRIGPTVLVWRMDVVHQAVEPVRELVLIDAHQGSVALNFNQIETARNRNTHSAGNTTVLPGTLVCSEANPTCSGGDADAVAAHVYAGDTYDYYASLGRDSLNNAGMTLTSTVHYGPVGYQNAFWNGSQMAYGDGFAQSDDVVGHELTHGVTQFTSNLFYYYQSGAINESLSDVFGEFIDQLNGRGNDSPAVRWLLGEDIPGVGAIRNMQNPSAYGDPDRMTSSFYYTGTGDNGGVHSNSGINNKAAYLMVDGGTFNGQTIGGLGLAKVGRIYYEVEANLLTSGSDYFDLHEALYQGCNNLVGTAGIVAADCQQVRNATLAVEMHLQPVPGFNPDAPLCAPGQLPVNNFFDNIEAGLGNFTMSAAVGSVRWSGVQGFAHSGRVSLYGDDFLAGPGDSSVALASGVTLPAGAFLHFAHAFGFQTPGRDGGVVEYSINGGATWIDAGPLIDTNGYRGTINTGFSNPLGGRSAFIDTSHGYISTRLNLASLAGQSVRFRWRLGLDSSGFDLGWLLDDVRVYRCSGATITSLVPNTQAQGRMNVNVAVTGQETHFAQGSTTGNFGPGITINSITVADSTHATANITISPNAALGARDVSFTTGGEQAIGLNVFTVTQGPQLTFITPNRGQPGQMNLSVAFTGYLTNFIPGQTTANFGPSISTISTTVVDATHATAVITIDANAALGFRNVTMTTGDEVAMSVGGFLVRVLPAGTQVYAYVLGRRLSPSQGGSTGIQTVNVINTSTNAIVATIPVGRGCFCVGPDGIAVHPDGTRVYVTNEIDNTVSVIDALTNAVVATVPVGAGPSAVTVSPDGSRVFVVNGSGATSVSVLDSITNSVLATIPLGVVQARGITISPDGTRVYVTTYGTGSVKVINTASNTVVSTISTGNIGLGLDATPNGARLYVATYPIAGSGNTPWVSVIDMATNTLVGNIGGIPQSPSDVGITPDGGRAYVIAQSTAVINTATNGIIATIPYPASGSSVEFTPDGARAYVATYGNVGVVNAQTNTVIGTISFTEAANGWASSVAMSPGSIRTLSLSGNLAFGSRPVGATAHGTLVISNAGNAALTVNSITYPPGFTGNWSGGTIAAKNSQTIVVAFTPTSAAGYGGLITVNANHNGGPSTIITSGTGIAFPRVAADFDDDGRADIGIFRHTDGLWAIARSSGGSTMVGWGDPVSSLDMPVAADYDGDGKADIAVYRRTTGGWFINHSATGTLFSVNWGAPSLGDVPVPADYDGDGKADIAVYRHRTGDWFIIRSSNGTLLQPTWGAPALGDVPVPADYDGDGLADIAVHRLSTGEWFILRSTDASLLQVSWGAPSLGDIPVVGDYDGDGKADLAVYRRSTGGWFISRSSNSSLLAINWGAPSLGDLPVPGDYDGDGKADVAVYRHTTGDWYILRSTNSTLFHIGWGAPDLGDSPPQYP